MIPAVPQVRWKVQLTGRSEELQALAKMFGPRGGPPRIRVWFEDERCYLHAPEFDTMVDMHTVLERGQILVRRLSGLGRLKFRAFRPVEVGMIVQPTAAGGSGNTLVLSGDIVLHVPTPELRAYLDYTPDRPPAMNAVVGPIVAALPPAEEWVDVADGCTPDVDDALYLLTVGTTSGDWRLLYMVYEIIEEHVRDPSKIERLGWGTRDEITRFKDTANSRGALGIKARHGRKKKPHPPNPMTFDEAQELVQGLLRAWVRSRAEGTRRAPGAG